MAVDAMPPGPIRLPDAATSYGSINKQYGRYKNSRTAAASFVPHQHFSNAKVIIMSKIDKLFNTFF